MFTFKRKLIAYSMLVSIIPVVIFGWISAHILTSSIREEIERSHETTLEEIKFQLDQFGANVQTASIYLASDDSVQQSIAAGSSSKNTALMLKMANTITDHKVFSPIPFDATVIYTKDNYFYSTKDRSIPYTNSIYYRIMQSVKPKYNKAVIITPHTYSNQQELLLFRPVPLTSYYTEGILVIHVSVHQMMLFMDKMKLGYESKIFVVDKSGRIVINRDESEIGSQLTSLTDLYEFWRNPESLHGTYSLGGEQYKVSSMNSAVLPWTYLVLTPTKSLTEKPQKIKILTWLIAALLMILWILISFVGSKRIYFPIERLLKKFSLHAGMDNSSDGIKRLDTYLEEMESSNQRLMSQLKEYVPHLKERIYHQLLWGELSDSEIRTKIEQLDLPLRGSWFYVCVVAVDEYSDFLKAYQGKDRSLIHYALRKMTQEIFEMKMPCITMVPKTGQIAVLIVRNQNGKDTRNEIFSLADVCRTEINNYFNFTISITISEGHQHLSNINLSYDEAISLLNYRLLMGRNVTIEESKVKREIQASGRDLIDNSKSIVFQVAQGNLVEANAFLERIIVEIPKYIGNSEAVLGLFSKIIGDLDILLYELGLELGEIFEFDLYQHLYSLHTLHDIQSWFGEVVFPAVVEQMNKATLSKRQQYSQQVIHYLELNVEKDLSLQAVADHFKLSPSYLSRIFKEETGQYFGNYVIELRLQKAKDWLEHTSMPVKEIADRLCYTTLQSFSRIFKQKIGCPPGEYRKRFREDA